MRPASGRIEPDDVRMRSNGVVLVHLLGFDVQVALDDAEEAALAGGGRVAHAACRRHRPAAAGVFQQVGSAPRAVA